MSFGNDHTENHCDRCCLIVGKPNLYKVPFLFKDMNDKSHEDLGQGYRQYMVCDACLKMEERIKIGQDNYRHKKIEVFYNGLG